MHDRSAPLDLPALFVCAILMLIASGAALAAPKVIVISLDGATPRLVEEFIRDGTIPRDRGLGLLKRHGLSAEQNVTVNPSLTAAGHIGIATGSSAARNDVVANSFHLLASPFASNISGFAAPIGGYLFDALRGPSEHGHSHATAEPLWIALRDAGRKVVTATWPGGDGVDIRVPGLGASPIIQSAAKRTVDYTVPFGAFGGAGAQGFALNAASFGPAAATTVAALTAAGRTSFSPVRQTVAPLETLTVAGIRRVHWAAALDTTNDGTVNYDTLVIWDEAQGIRPGPFARPATGPAYVKAADRRSEPFYFEGDPNRAGAGFYVTRLAPDLSTVRLVRYSANFIPRNPAVLGVVDDINANVGFWAPQPDFRIPQRQSPGFDTFPDEELEAAYADLVATFTGYQTRVALRAIERNPNADLVLIYFEQPDGSAHQFLLTDPRQATNPRDAQTIGPYQDAAKRARYRDYVKNAYKVANEAVQRVIDAVGTDRRGRPASDIFVVSDHGFAPFHTTVSMTAFLAAKGFDPKKVRAITSGPAVNLYINLQGREPDGTVTREEYLILQKQLVQALREYVDINTNFVLKAGTLPVFDQVVARPTPSNIADASFGLLTNGRIGQDSGDVYATLAIGYNFDGLQTPVVRRLGDFPNEAILSAPSFYGAHGYDPRIADMSAIFYAAGPNICRGEVERVRNIDIAPTVLDLLGVEPAPTVQGRAIRLCSRRD